MPAIRKINVAGVAGLPAFCHATVVGEQVFVSGMLGAAPGGMELVPGGIAAETTRALRNIETILAACGCGLDDVAKVNVYLTDMAGFVAMNEAYLGVFGADPPARITVGCTALALGARVEMDCVAFRPDDAPALGDMP
ncbi:MAG TPA: RidA family protein [Streptosporangiaceae bacterium]|jgi:reactive intermediate/imine deaminase|nr:RidA family protein [Streptosporangiaceae bacterium]